MYELVIFLCQFFSVYREKSLKAYFIYKDLGIALLNRKFCFNIFSTRTEKVYKCMQDIGLYMHNTASGMDIKQEQS